MTIYKNYWMTVSVPAKNKDEAERMATEMALILDGNVVQVDQEPPQGALIVGDMREDG